MLLLCRSVWSSRLARPQTGFLFPNRGGGARVGPTAAFGSSSPQRKKRKITPAANIPARPPMRARATTTERHGGGDFLAALPTATAAAPQPKAEDALDMTPLLTALEPIDAYFRAKVRSLLHGGRFSPDCIGALLVALGPGTGGQAFPLHELAQVVPRSSRAVLLLVNDARHIKPIMSAVQQSPDFNQQPQRDPDNPLELHLHIEPDRKADLLRRLHDALNDWKDRVRQVRSRHDKLHKEWRRAGTLLPDVAKRAERELQKAQDKKMRQIDAEGAQAAKQLQDGG